MREVASRSKDKVAQYRSQFAGVYIWGKDWIQAKTQAECYDYLFGSAIEMHKLGTDASRPPAPPPVAQANANGHHDADAAPAPKRQRHDR